MFNDERKEIKYSDNEDDEGLPKIDESAEDVQFDGNQLMSNFNHPKLAEQDRFDNERRNLMKPLNPPTYGNNRSLRGFSFLEGKTGDSWRDKTPDLHRPKKAGVRLAPVKIQIG